VETSSAFTAKTKVFSAGKSGVPRLDTTGRIPDLSLRHGQISLIIGPNSGPQKPVYSTATATPVTMSDDVTSPAYRVSDTHNRAVALLHNQLSEGGQRDYLLHVQIQSWACSPPGGYSNSRFANDNKIFQRPRISSGGRFGPLAERRRLRGWNSCLAHTALKQRCRRCQSLLLHRAPRWTTTDFMFLALLSNDRPDRRSIGGERCRRALFRLRIDGHLQDGRETGVNSAVTSCHISDFRCHFFPCLRVQALDLTAFAHWRVKSQDPPQHQM
jgi:hypothetical protein